MLALLFCQPASRRFFGPKAPGSNCDSVVSMMSGPLQMARTAMSGPNSFSTWRQAPQGGVGTSVGV
ncbi:hypothetical protein D3C86_2190640 [compost metagenome]